MTIGSAIIILDSAFAKHAKVDLDMLSAAINKLQTTKDWELLSELQRKAFKIIPEMLRDALRWGVDDAYGYASDLLETLKNDLHNCGLI